MIKKEISEIKKQFTHSGSTISKIAGCYVGSEKEKISKINDTFLCLPEEETFKYFEIFSKSLSGTLGKNLLNIEFSLDSEFGDGQQKLLMDLRDSGLKDEELLDKFYDRVIDSYDYIGNYLILLVHAAYDIPGVTSDGLDMDDASDEVYEHIICCICPVELEKPALSYDMDSNHFAAKERKWVLSLPAHGFLFPAFNDRSTDIHAALYYTKNAEKPNMSFMECILGQTGVMTAGNQKESFHELITKSLAEECEYEVVRNIQEKVNEIVAENKDEPAPVVLDKTECVKVLEACGVRQEKCAEFEQHFDDEIGEKGVLQATNIVDIKAMKVKTANVEIKVSPENSELLETKMIDGKRCIVIMLDDNVTVNGIPVRSGRILPEEEE